MQHLPRLARDRPLTPLDPKLPRTLPRHAARLAIRAYQLTLSSLVGRQCRHAPSCSAYADEAILRHGLWIGGWMGLARLLRCQPWGTAGYDPVPDVPRHARWYRPWQYGSWRWRHGREIEPR